MTTTKARLKAAKRAIAPPPEDDRITVQIYYTDPETGQLLDHFTGQPLQPPRPGEKVIWVKPPDEGGNYDHD
jgi:hypothetical protein